MGLILDTSILIATEKLRFDLNALLEDQEESSVYLASITASELLHGVHRAVSTKQREKRSAFVEDVLLTFPILPLDLAIARCHAQVWAALEKKGQSIGYYDLVIAATALEHGHSIATLNESEFERVPGLQLLNVSPFLRTPI
ncbi:MAG: type II toxin-antitoxin system VapC family toxin [Prosthecobacter sp.]|nr:type II toxin-antitoxin system VapC family toxin [Prosthecobacter sp.]